MTGLTADRARVGLARGVWCSAALSGVLACALVACGDDDGGPLPRDSGVGDAGLDSGDVRDAAPDAPIDDDAGDEHDAAIDGGVAGPTFEYLKASTISAGAEFGRAIAVSGDTLVVGAPGEAGGGGVHVFVRGVGGWVEQARLVGDNTEGQDRFGSSVAIDGDTVVVGATGERSAATGVTGDGADNTLTSAGAAYVFTRTGSTWTQQAYLKASNTGANDNFGQAVAVSGDTIAVGAHAEASDATGIDGDQENNNASFSGAVYVFTRAGSTWTQQAYVKASNAETFDRFGFSLALDADTLAVGAYLEDALTPNINGDQGNNLGTDSGAVYVFTRAGTTWSQQAYVKASNVGGSDHFGWSVAIEEHTLVVGARSEDATADDPLSNDANDSGAVYVFSRAGDQWSERARLKASPLDSFDAFGTSVAIYAGGVVVGATNEDSAAGYPDRDPADNSASNAGAAYVFIPDGESYTQYAYLKAHNPRADAQFGGAVAAGTAGVVVGSPAERSANGEPDNTTAMNAGAAYSFSLTD